MPLVLEPDRTRLEHTETLEEYFIAPVDENISDRWVLEKWFQWAQSEKFVEDVPNELLALGIVQGVVLLAQFFANDVPNLGFDLFA